LVEGVRRVAAHYRLYLDDDGQPMVYAKPYFVRDGDGSLRLCNVPVPAQPIERDALPAEEHAFVDLGGRHPRLRGLVTSLGLKSVAQRFVGFDPCPEYRDPSHPSWRTLSDILAAWSASAGAPVLLVPLPLYHHVEGLADSAPYQKCFRRLAEHLGCHFHDPLPDLVAYDAETRRGFRFRDDIHPTPAGHEALARSLAPVVARILSLAPVGN
jgi:carbamoyltransferase